jgi:hypothetical protein
MKPGGRSNQSVTGVLTNQALDRIRSMNQPVVFSNGYSVGGPGYLSPGVRRPISSISAFSEPTVDKRDMFESPDSQGVDEDEPESSVSLIDHGRSDVRLTHSTCRPRCQGVQLRVIVWIVPCLFWHPAGLEYRLRRSMSPLSLFEGSHRSNGT